MNSLFLFFTFLISTNKSIKFVHISHEFKNETNDDILDIYMASILVLVFENIFLNIDETFNKYYEQLMIKNEYIKIINNTKKLLICILSKKNLYKNSDSITIKHSNLIEHFQKINCDSICDKFISDLKGFSDDVKNQILNVSSKKNYCSGCFFIFTIHYIRQCAYIDSNFIHENILLISSFEKEIYISIQDKQLYYIKANEKNIRKEKRCLFINTTLFEFTVCSFIVIICRSVEQKQATQECYNYIKKLIYIVKTGLLDKNNNDATICKICEFRTNFSDKIKHEKDEWLDSYDEFYLSYIFKDIILFIIEFWLGNNLCSETQTIDEFKFLFIEFYEAIFYNTFEFLNCELIQNTKNDNIKEKFKYYIYKL